MKINDAVIGCVACTFDILAAVCYVFVTEPWQLFISNYNTPERVARDPRSRRLTRTCLLLQFRWSTSSTGPR